jgi:hypothetical protein
LDRIHRANIAHFSGGAIRNERVIKDPAEFLRTGRHEATPKLDDNGYDYVNQKRQVSRQSWKEAVWMAWKNLWPITPIRELFWRWRAARLLREPGYA